MHKTGVTWSLIIVLFKSLTAATWIVCICNWCFWKARIHSSVVIKADGYKSINNKHFGLNLKWLRGLILVVVSYLFYSFSKFFIESRPLSSAWHWLHLWTTDVWILWFIDYHITQSDVCLFHLSSAVLAWVWPSASSTYLIMSAGPLWTLDCLFKRRLSEVWQLQQKLWKNSLLACLQRHRLTIKTGTVRGSSSLESLLYADTLTQVLRTNVPAGPSDSYSHSPLLNQDQGCVWVYFTLLLLADLSASMFQHAVSMVGGWLVPQTTWFSLNTSCEWLKRLTSWHIDPYFKRWFWVWLLPWVSQAVWPESKKHTDVWY